MLAQRAKADGLLVAELNGWVIIRRYRLLNAARAPHRNGYKILNPSQSIEINCDSVAEAKERLAEMLDMLRLAA